MTQPAPAADSQAAPGHRDGIDVAEAAALDAGLVLRALGTSREGLTEDEAHLRLTHVGPNTVPEHRVTLVSVIGGELRSPLLILLVATALLSAVLGQQAASSRMPRGGRSVSLRSLTGVAMVSLTTQPART